MAQHDVHFVMSKLIFWWF